MAEQRTYGGYVYEKAPDGSWQRAGPAQPQGQVFKMSDPVKDATVNTQIQQVGADLNKTQAMTGEYGANATRAQASAADTMRTIRQNPISEKDQAIIDGMRQQAAPAAQLLPQIRDASKAADRFQGGPGKGAYYDAVMPETNDWGITAAAKGLLRTPLSKQSMMDYQALKSPQQSIILNEQQAQKGPQTESDAARMALAGVTPSNYNSVNAQRAAIAAFNAKMAMNKPDFYSRWANQHGSLGALDHGGQSVDKAWSTALQKGLEILYNDPAYIQATGAKPQASSDGWKIEQVGD